MAFSDYSATPSANVSIAGQNTAPGGPPSAVGPALRQIAADGRLISDKAYLDVDLYDALTPSMRASVNSGDQSVDCSPAINTIIDYANGGSSTGNATGGTNLYVKGGRYAIGMPISNTFRFDRSIVDDGDLRRLNIIGDGTANTTFFYTGSAATPLFTMKGYNSQDGRDSYQAIKGIRFRRSFGTGLRGTGTGVALQFLASLHFEDVHVDGFAMGIDAKDVLGLSADRLFVLGNGTGLMGQVSLWTRPNVWSFRDGAFSGNGNFGAYIRQGANLLFQGVRFEGNGDDRVNDFALFLENGPSEGGAWACIQSCYFEGNKVSADIKVANGGSDAGTIYIGSNSFNRADADRYAQFHIDLYSASVPLPTKIEANAFKSFNGYSPSSANPVWRAQTGFVSVTDVANYYQNTTTGATDESPTLPALASVASATTVTLPSNGQAYSVTGTATITSIVARPVDTGRRVLLIFASTASLTDGSNLKLVGNFTGATNATLSLVCDGSNWIELSRSAP
jgi:hypothetical protein